MAALGSDRPATVLVVDDAAANRYVLGAWLRRAGHHVVEAATGAEALDRVADTAVELVFLDVNLPDLSGFEVCDRIKNDPSAAGVPVVFVSATSVDAADRTRGLSEGADAYLTQPIDPDELVATALAMLRYSRARQHAERLATRLAMLAGATLHINAARSLEDLLTAAATGAAGIFEGPALVNAVGHDGAAISVGVPGPGRPARVHRHPPTPEIAAEPGRTIQLLEAPPREWLDVAEWATPGTPLLASIVASRGRRAPTAIALPGRGAALDSFPADEDRNLLSQLGQATALAVDALRSYTEERSVALTIQRSLLPRDLPSVKDVDIAVRYVPASATAEIGGDFYEVANLDGTLLVAIGDVVGHALPAATVMAELRHALRAYAIDGHGPAAIIDRLDAMMRQYHPGTLATVLLMLVDPGTGLATAATGGHLPPLLVTGDGAQYLDVKGTLLGVGPVRRRESTFTIPAGGTLVLVTDGLVETRGVPIDDGLEQLRVLSTTIDPLLDDYCNRILAALANTRGEDDIALLALRRSTGC